ncbi:WD40-repeat-containing domain protein [Bisporella sp. PMI_857]|nr:WD40-repeat-containing domain protein [Bisporella sp. PMI_857]
MEPVSTFSSDLNLPRGLFLASSYIVVPSQCHGTLVLNNSGELNHKIETGSQLAFNTCQENIFVATDAWKEPGSCIRVFDLDQKQEERSLTGPDGKNHQWSLLQLSNDAKILAVGTHHGEVMIWNLDSRISTPSKILSVDTDVVLVMKIHEGKLITSNKCGTIQIWDLFTGAYSHTFQGNLKWVTTAHFDQDSRMATSDFGGLTKVWNFKDGSCCLTFDLQSKNSPSFFFTRDKFVAMPWEGPFYVWNRVTLVLERVVPNSCKDVGRQGIWTGDGNIIITSGFDSKTTIQVWDLDCDNEQPLLKVPVFGLVSRLKSDDKMVVVLSMIKGVTFFSNTAVGPEFRVEIWNMDTIVNEAKIFRK